MVEAAGVELASIELNDLIYHQILNPLRLVKPKQLDNLLLNM